MPRVSKRRILKDEDYFAFLNDFNSAVTSFKNREETKLFFQDLLTKEEHLMLAKRFQASMMILAGYTQQEVDRQVKITQATVSKINQILELGRGNLANIADRILKIKANKVRERYKSRGYRYSESELLKQALGYTFAKVTDVIRQKRKEASIT